MMATQARSVRRMPGQAGGSLSGAPSNGAASRRHKPDYWLVALSVVLLAIGLVVVYSISPALSNSLHVSNNFYVFKQLIAIGLSMVAFAITSRVPLTWWRQAYKPLLIVAGIATLVALVMPVNPNYPAHRWVRIGSLSFQSVELVKFAILIWLAGFLSDRLRAGKLTDAQQTLKPLAIAIGIVGFAVAFVQSDLGSTAVILAMMGMMVTVAGLPIRKLATIALLVGAIALLAVAITPYRRERLAAYFHPEANCQTSGYQACQAMIAVGSGGMVGLGLGKSVQAYGYLPEAANDSIFAIYAEKFGFIGCVILLAVFVGLFRRLKNVAERAPNDFSQLVAVGVFAWLSVQSLINIGAMIGILPMKGITLPFISYGGTSVVFVAAAVGLVFQISHYSSFIGRSKVTDRKASDDNRAERRRVGGAYHPDFGSRT
jgi:cell division protein FtsW